MFTVAGSGFGLYGYLPALVEAFGEPVLLPRAYRERAAARAELAPYLDRVRWVNDQDEALAEATGAVVATVPARQPEIARRCFGLPAMRSIVLEKPLAVTPAAARDLLADVARAGKRLRVGYMLQHTEWAPRLALPKGAPVEIDWTFMAHHFAHGLDNWKARHADGGGVLRFYGVHVLALLAQNGYSGVERSVLRGADDARPEAWEAEFSGPALPPCRVRVDCRAQQRRFRIAAHGAALVDLRDPFETEPPVGPPGADPRIGILVRLLATLRAPDAPHVALYEAANALWAAAESAIRFEARAG
jgi:hypothetical protein